MKRKSGTTTKASAARADRSSKEETDRAKAALENVSQGYGHVPAGAADDPPGEGLSDRALDDRPPAPPSPPAGRR